MNLIKVILAALAISVPCSTQLAATTMSMQQQDKIREYLYSDEVDFDNLNDEDIAQYKEIIQNHIIILEQALEQKNASYDVVQGTVLAGLSAIGVYFYFSDIVYPNVIALAKRKGLSFAINFNKNFIKNSPKLAIYFATPLFAALILGKLSYNYFKKDWNYKKSLEIALSLDKTILARLENAEQRN